MRFSFAIFFGCFGHGLCVFFIMGEKESRCFYDDYSEDTLVSFQYNATILKESPVGLVVRVQNPDYQVILLREYGSGSTISFKAERSGEYSICLSTNSTKWAMYAKGKIKVHFKFDIEVSGHRRPEVGAKSTDNDDDEEEEDEEKDKNKELLAIEERLYQVTRSVHFIAKMQESQRFAEERFRSIAETTNSRVFVWAAVQLSLLLLTGWWQMRSLRAFFIAKKLV